MRLYETKTTGFDIYYFGETPNWFKFVMTVNIYISLRVVCHAMRLIQLDHLWEVCYSQIVNFDKVSLPLYGHPILFKIFF